MVERHGLATIDPGQRGTLLAVTSDPCFKTRAYDTDLLSRWLCGGIQDLGEPAVSEQVLDWLDPFITRVERDRIVAWNLGVSLCNPVLAVVFGPVTEITAGVVRGQ